VFSPRELGFRAGVAQLVEHLICNQRVGGSNPFASSSKPDCRANSGGNAASQHKVFVGINSSLPSCESFASPLLAVSPARKACIASDGTVRAGCYGDSGTGPIPDAMWICGWMGEMDRRSCAQVAERLMAADCKSAAPCELRRFESSPVHHSFRLVVVGNGDE